VAQVRQQELMSGLSRRAEVCYYAGSLLKGFVNEGEWTVFGTKCDFHEIKPLLRLLQTFERNQKGACEAVHTWLLVAQVLNRGGLVVVNRDMRAKIGLLIWQLRFAWHIKFH
jgi:hypothetical protein